MDCVGPLPKSRTGSKYLLTIMCQTTRFPATYPLRSITTKTVLKALTQFIALFGIPKIIQTDQGSNFTSTLFAQILKQLHVKHQKASAYHARSVRISLSRLASFTPSSAEVALSALSGPSALWFATRLWVPSV